MTNIDVYGDSILKGVTFDKEKCKYTINNLFAGIENVNVFNFSKFGCTVDKGKDIVDKNIENNKLSQTVIVELGGNDSDFCWSEVSENPKDEHFSKNTLENFYKKYTALISKIKAQGVKPIIMSILPVDAEKYLDWICKDGLSKENILYWLGDVYAIYRYQEQFSHTVERIAMEQNLPLLDMRGAFLKKRQMKELFAVDGIHPSIAGQEVIKTELKKFVACNLV